MSLLKSFIFAIVAIALLVPAFVARALMAPQIYFTGDAVIGTSSFSSGDKITGTVELWNYEDYAISDLVFRYQLLAGEKNGTPTELIDNSQAGDIFSLAAGKRETKSIEYLLPVNLESGNYTFRIQLANGRGEEMAWADKVINVGGNGKFLSIADGVIVKDGEELSAGAGVYYDPGQTATIQFKVSNGSGFTMTASPNIVTYNRNVGPDTVNKKTETAVVLNPGESKTLSFSLPATNIPETYISEVTMVDPASGETVSNVLLFRWIISGESARALFVTSDKEAYAAGEEAKINVQYNGPADHEVDGGTGTLDIKLTDSQGVVVGKVSQPIELKPGSVTVPVPVEKSVDNFKIETTIEKDGKGFDKYEVEVNAKNRPAEISATSGVEKEKGGITSGKMLIIISAVVLLMALILNSMKKKTGAGTVCFIILFSAGLLTAGGGVLAATEVTGGCCDTTVIYNQPHPGVMLQPGGPVDFSTRFRVTSCGDGLFFNRATYYITEDKDIPIVDAKGRNYDDCTDTACTVGDCLSCFGANSSTYGCGHYVYGNVAKYLDTTQGYKIFKLGSSNSADVGGHGASDWPHWVEMNKSFTVPQNIGIYGPVRLYVEYIGSHWDGHWHWNVAYQKAYIRAIPSAQDLESSQPDYCTMNPAASFKWSFASDDVSASQASYRIQIAKNQSFANLVYDSQVVNTGSESYSIPVGIIDYDKTYYWRLKVIDSYGMESDWILGGPFSTPVQAAPHPVINFAPKTPIVLQRMSFDSATSYCYSGPNKIACGDDSTVAYRWDFGNGDTSTLAGDTTVFESKDEYTVKLNITSGSLTCSTSKVMNVNETLPTWQEVGD